MPTRVLGVWLVWGITLFVLSFQTLAADDQHPTFSQAELDQIMAPIALYPDSLLSQILMASTYPAEVTQAVAWSKQNPQQQGDAAVKAVQDKVWEPNVASLVAFPQVLAMMGDKPDWVKKMGDAFLAQPGEVMNTVQKLRKKVQDAGNLKSTEQQKVIVDTSASQQTVIKIEPATPQVVYVPTYNPTVVYGSWWWPAYPPFYYPPPLGYGFAAGVATGIGFGVGIAVTNAMWGSFDWNHHDVHIDVNHYNNINVNHRLDVNKSSVSWNHNAVNRRGVPYADQANRQKYGQKLDGADMRQNFSGRDTQREQAAATLKGQGIDPAAERQKLSGAGGERVREQMGRLGRDQNNAFSGLGNGSRSHMSATRGEFSTGSFRGGLGGGGMGDRFGGGRFGGSGFVGRIY